MSVPESDELARHRDKQELQAKVRERIATLSARSTRSSTLQEIDRMLIDEGFGWVVAEVTR